MKKLIVIILIFGSASAAGQSTPGQLFYIITPIGQGAYIMIDPARNTHPCMDDGSGNIVCRW